MIQKDLSSLPNPSNVANLPVKDPVIVNRVGQAWYDKYLADGRAEYASAIPELPYRASSAGMRCDRQLWAALHDIERSNPPGLADSWRMGLGSMVHDALEPILTSMGDDWRAEVNVDLRPIGIPGSAHADLVHYVRTEEVRHYSDGDSIAVIDKPDIVVEFKTINGFGFKRHATNFKGPAEGPRFGHILQGAMSAAALGAPTLIICYMAMELVGVDLAKAYSNDEVGRFGAEWRYDMADLMPYVNQEAARINRLLRYTKDEVPAAEIVDEQYPTGSVIKDARTGRWQVEQDGNVVASGKVWYCSYCSWQDWCLKVEPDTVSVCL